MNHCSLVTKPYPEKNEKQELCGSLLKTMEPSQKAIYDNYSGEMIFCLVDPKYPENTIGRVGSHEACMRRFVQNEHPEAVTLAEEIERMYRSTRLQKGAAGISLWMEAFSPDCSIQADRIAKAIEKLESNKWLDKDDHIHVSLLGPDCDSSFGGLVDDVKRELNKFR